MKGADKFVEATKKQAPHLFNDHWLSVADAAKYIGVDVNTLYYFLKIGSIPKYTYGKRYRVAKADLDRWLDAKTTPKTRRYALNKQVNLS